MKSPRPPSSIDVNDPKAAPVTPPRTVTPPTPPVQAPVEAAPQVVEAAPAAPGTPVPANRLFWNCPVHGKTDYVFVLITPESKIGAAYCCRCLSTLFEKYGAPDLPLWVEPTTDPEARIG